MSETKQLAGRDVAYNEAVSRLAEFDGTNNQFILALDRGEDTECIVSGNLAFVMNLGVEMLTTGMKNVPDGEKAVALASVLRAMELPPNTLAAATTIALGNHEVAVQTLEAIVTAINEKSAGVTTN